MHEVISFMTTFFQQNYLHHRCLWVGSSFASISGFENLRCYSNSDFKYTMIHTYDKRIWLKCCLLSVSVNSIYFFSCIWAIHKLRLMIKMCRMNTTDIYAYNSDIYWNRQYRKRNVWSWYEFSLYFSLIDWAQSPTCKMEQQQQQRRRKKMIQLLNCQPQN